MSIQDATTQLNHIREKSTENDKVIEALKEELARFKMQDDLFKERTGFIKAIYPDEISSVSYARGQLNDFAIVKENIPMYIIDWNIKDHKDIPIEERNSQRQRRLRNL